MKKLLGVLVLGLLLSSNAYARIIKLKCNPIGFEDRVNNKIYTDFIKIRLDTKLKKLSLFPEKFKGRKNIHRNPIFILLRSYLRYSTQQLACDNIC